ncbi:hypothetical protein [Borreliella valaisiana]|uniref:BB0158 famile outer surface lipoprotein n=1 Tax=Borreliella valaisiana TaxID=62088 RepID=UPI003B211921
MPDIDFERYRTGFASISLKEISKEPGYINSCNFGFFSDDLTNSFKLLYKNSESYNETLRKTFQYIFFILNTFHQKMECLKHISAIHIILIFISNKY